MAKRSNYAERIRWANEAIIGKGDAGSVGEHFAPSYVAHIGAGFTGTGPAFVRRFVKQLRTALPDVRVMRVEVLLESGDRVAWRRTLRGTHKADLMGIPPSGKRITWCDMLVSRFNAKGKVAEEWVVSDLAGRSMESLG